MPTIYKPVKVHRPLDWGAVSAKIRGFLNYRHEKLARLIGADPDDLLPSGDHGGHIELSLIQFLAACTARPLRTKNKLKATLLDIVKNPSEFIKNPTPYDPEVVDWVYGAYARQSAKHKAQLLGFEIGEVTLTNEAVSAAAAAALENILIANVKKGRSKDHILISFASLALSLFESGGRRGTATSGGPFWRFVELLREPVLRVAMEAGCALSVEPVVREGVRQKTDRVKVLRHPISSVDAVLRP